MVRAKAAKAAKTEQPKPSAEWANARARFGKFFADGK